MARALGRKNKGEEEESEIDLTPMLDVVFIMLIFFIVTASYVKESGLEVNRPESQKSDPSDAQNILVKINATGEIYMEDRRTDVRAVRAVIERMRAENPKAAVIVSAHNKAENEVFAAVIDAAREAGAWDVSLTTREE
jgi:biopolymer transport protein ExbD